MYIDKLLELSLDQAVTSTAASTNVADLGKGMGATEDLALVVTVTETATAAGAATVTLNVQGDDAEGFGTAVTLLSSAIIGKAALVAGASFILPMPKGSLKKYLRMQYVVATGPLTAGKFTCQIVEGFQYNPALPGKK
jgi:hypothetical protein